MEKCCLEESSRGKEAEHELQAGRNVVALSGVHGKPSRQAKLRVHNPTAAAIAAAVGITGKDAGLFRAGLRIGDAAGGTLVILQGIGLAAFEGKNEPSLQSIVHAPGVPLDGGGAQVEFDAPAEPFAFYMMGHKFASFTDPRIKTAATIGHTVRVYPVRFFQGKKLENSYLVGFGEASNGDGQDAAFLIENVTPAGD